MTLIPEPLPRVPEVPEAESGPVILPLGEAGMDRLAAAILDSVEVISDLRQCLEASTVALVLERDSLYDSVTTEDGTFMDPDDERQVRELDQIIDANRNALARARKN